jgi:ubiquinone/menaquinone biosynthesis C-methylase UbiE
MREILWTGELPFMLKAMVNFSGIISWMTGKARNVSAMKERTKGGYDGVYSDYVNRYDDLGGEHYRSIAERLLSGIEVSGKAVVDVGCGTGILSQHVLERGAVYLTCCDISDRMLDQCKAKLDGCQSGHQVIDYYPAEAEKLPLENEGADLVVSNMMLGMIPNHHEVVNEMTRIIRSGGQLALSTHGASYYREAIEATLRSMSLAYFINHRFEFWPRSPTDLTLLLSQSGLVDIQTDVYSVCNSFLAGEDAFDFFAATSALWWYELLPSHRREQETDKMRRYFKERNVSNITTDVVFVYGTKL